LENLVEQVQEQVIDLWKLVQRVQDPWPWHLPLKVEQVSNGALARATLSGIFAQATPTLTLERPPLLELALTLS
jgi:hypothetical protein